MIPFIPIIILLTRSACIAVREAKDSQAKCVIAKVLVQIANIDKIDPTILLRALLGIGTLVCEIIPFFFLFSFYSMPRLIEIQKSLVK